MTEKRFLAIAEAFATTRPMRREWEQEKVYFSRLAVWKRTASEVASVLCQFNPQFAHEMFMDACGAQRE